MRLFLFSLSFLVYSSSLSASTCSPLFAGNLSTERFFSAAADTFKNPFLQDIAEQIAQNPKAVNNLNIAKGVSPKQWESILYKLSTTSDEPSIKPSFKTKLWLENRLNILLAVKQLDRLSEDLSLARKSSQLEMFKHHWQLVSFPNFFAPSFLFSNYFSFNNEILDSFEHKGFEYTYNNLILPKYPYLARADTISRNLPTITSFALASTIIATTVFEFWPEAEYNLTFDKKVLNGTHFQLWKEARIEEGLSIDIQKEAIRKDWTVFLYDNYETLFKPEFERRHGREPDLSLPSDRESWYNFTHDYITWFKTEPK